MIIEKAEMTIEGLLLKTFDPAARRFVWEFNPGDYDLSPVKKKRSLNSNAYAWVLMGKMGDALRMSKEEIYFEMLKSYGQCGAISVQDKFTEKFKRTYKYHESLGKSDLKGKTFEHFRFWVGSSEYNQEEMGIFIDGIVQEAKQLGIETLTPEELRRMNDEWA